MKENVQAIEKYKKLNIIKGFKIKEQDVENLWFQPKGATKKREFRL